MKTRLALLLLTLLTAGCTSTGGFDGAAFSSGARTLVETATVFDRLAHPERYPVYYPAPGY